MSGASAGGTTVASAAAASTVGIDATIAADGTVLAASAGGWEARRIGLGTYELTFAQPIDLTVRRWDASAVAAVRPVADATWLISFGDEDGGVDTDFSFAAMPTGD